MTSPISGQEALGPGVAEQLHKRAIPICLERINCNQAWSRKRLDPAYAALGLAPNHGITDASIAGEQGKLDLADYLFCPSPQVIRSFQEEGIAAKKLLPTSYGWAPERFPQAGARRTPIPNDPPTVLFVGMLCVRKGIPQLLQAWEQLQPKARLILCGRVLDDLDRHFAKQLARPEVTLLQHTDSIGQLYEQADFFVFPSLEEGGPLVTYEAMAHGLVPLVSPMGAGAVVRDGRDGFVVAENTAEAWAGAIRTALQSSPAALARISSAAVRRANEFTWERVALQRAQLFQERMS